MEEINEKTDVAAFEYFLKILGIWNDTKTFLFSIYARISQLLSKNLQKYEDVFRDILYPRYYWYLIIFNQ